MITTSPPHHYNNCYPNIFQCKITQFKSTIDILGPNKKCTGKTEHHYPYYNNDPSSNEVQLGRHQRVSGQTKLCKQDLSSQRSVHKSRCQG